MEVLMRKYNRTEREKHLENWMNGTISRTEYAKSAGIKLTTFYKWAQDLDKTRRGFVKIDQSKITGNFQNIIIEKNGIALKIPISADLEGLKTIFEALGIIQ